MNSGGRNFFVFKINPGSVGDFDFGRIPREWSDEIGKFLKFLLFYFLFFLENSTLRSLLAFFNLSSLICRALWSCTYDYRASRTDYHSAAR